MDHYSFFGAPSPEAEKERGIAPATPASSFEDQEKVSAAPPESISGFSPGVPELEVEENHYTTFLPTPSPGQEEPAADLDAALQALVQKAQYTSNASGAALALRQGADVVCRAASGSSAPDRGARLQIKSGLTAECLRSGELLHCDNVTLDPRVDLESCRRLGIEAIIITPIHQGKKLVGVLELFAAHAYSFQERDVEAVKGLARDVGKLLAEGPVAEVEPEPIAAQPGAGEKAPCSSCGAPIANDTVFCPVCGSFQEARPATAASPAGWKASLNSRRLLVPAVFVAMALAVAVAPIPRHQAKVAPAPQPALQAAAVPPLSASTRGVHTDAVAKSPAAMASGKTASPAANNSNISSSVKQILGGVSSDFSKLLPVNEKAEPPSNGDPNLRVWVDTHKGYYYCPGEEQYGHTAGGAFMTQKEAESNYYIPALVKPCM